MGLCLLGVFVLTLRLIAGSLDRQRIDRYLRQRRCELLQCTWAPFGRGWFGERSDRIYELRYRDADGNVHSATAKTSMWTGVYLTEDAMVYRARRDTVAADASPEDLAAENARLRAEIARLRRRH